MDWTDIGKRGTGKGKRRAVFAAISIIVTVSAAGGACSGGGSPKASRPPLTQRQRDSAIGESRLPGAGGVKRALRAVDSAEARRAREDSIR